jgi:hypothetical protein
MEAVNSALSEMGRDTLSGVKLLQEVLRHPDTPLDVKIQCAGVLTKVETAPADNKNYVAEMPKQVPGDTPRQRLAVWWALNAGTDDPEIVAEAEKFLALVAAKGLPGASQ